MAQKILTIDEAIDEIRERHDKAAQKPLLVGVFGAVNSGKSYFCARACNKLADTGKPPHGGVCGTNDYFFNSYIRLFYPEFEYLFYSIIPSWTDQMPHERDIDSWNRSIGPYTGRPLDVNAVIFNPNFHQPNVEYLSQVFNIVISNPKSKRKNLKV